MELKIDKKYIDEAVQKAVEELKQNNIWIPEGMTNGEVIQVLWRVQKITILEVCVFVDCYPNVNMRFDKVWWNAPYKSEKPETCKGCLEPCIMYEPDMRACKKKRLKR